MRKLITAPHVAEKLGVTTHRVYLLQRENRLPGVVRISERQIRFDEMAIDEWISRGGNSEQVQARAQAA